MAARSTGTRLTSRTRANGNTRSTLAPRSASPPSSTESDLEGSRPAKKRKTTAAGSKMTSSARSALFAPAGADEKPRACALPGRVHSTSYHRPLLLSDKHAQDRRRDLLTWFDTVTEKRGMPWRKPYLGPLPASPDVETRRAYEKRAYEVWISEIMLQQTRVAVVIDYWNRWMEKWPTIQDLAAADADDVLAAWRGLGYYSRATRIHEAAKKVVADTQMDGLLPQNAKDLEAKIPGVGRYTAGAICSIVFGVPEPMVDGNVLRVLSRQLGVLGDVKTTKSVIDLLWAAADALVKAVASDCRGDDDSGPREQTANEGPGRWGQALMELGSTICTPKPRCGECPIAETCKAFQEGLALAGKTKPTNGSHASVKDMEDLCTLCEPYEHVAEGLGESRDKPKTTKAPKKGSAAGQAKLTAFAFTKSDDKTAPPKLAPEPTTWQPSVDRAVEHAKLFPVKAVKKALRQEDTLVCVLRLPDQSYLIEQRPDKGLLASLWEFPSRTLTEAEAKSAKERKAVAQRWSASLLSSYGLSVQDHATYQGELGSIPWVFSHLKLTMHVHLFDVGSAYRSADDFDADALAGVKDRRRWTGDPEEESMGTGMRKCWALVQQKAGAEGA